MHAEYTANISMTNAAAAMAAERARWAAALAAPSKPARRRTTVRKTSFILRVLRALLAFI